MFFCARQVDRAEEVPPPIMVVVMGPRGSGKTTLIRSLIKLYTGKTQGLATARRSLRSIMSWGFEGKME